jgi:hypothetical protein
MQMFTEQFPDFNPQDMPDFPVEWFDAWGFFDTSWYNDACPSFTSDKLGLTLWVNYADPARREFGGARYVLGNQDHGVEVGTWSLETDDFAVVLEEINRRMVAQS